MTTTLTTPAELAAHHGWRRVLAVGAHPDDLDFGAAATLAGFSAAGLHIELCIVTDGDAGGFDSEGPEAMTARRHAEQRAALLARVVEEAVPVPIRVLRLARVGGAEGARLRLRHPHPRPLTRGRVTPVAAQ